MFIIIKSLKLVLRGRLILIKKRYNYKKNKDVHTHNAI